MVQGWFGFEQNQIRQREGIRPFWLIKNTTALSSQDERAFSLGPFRKDSEPRFPLIHGIRCNRLSVSDASRNSLEQKKNSVPKNAIYRFS